ncbi:uncharacterized protein LOC107610450 [Arachis ipaensis]|uniref:uncharacterized protein LOC107610450 n=1 Tax=Arachis ipaensis TaxID=130454 RepID=UPI0007AFC5F2|nr:uncharacterized protein LOC107610450 [Arachis ipaensis]
MHVQFFHNTVLTCISNESDSPLTKQRNEFLPSVMKTATQTTIEGSPSWTATVHRNRLSLGLQRAKVFLWQLAHNAVLTASRTVGWGRENNPNCMSCDNDIETPFHVIRDCPMSSPVWNCRVKLQNIGMFYNLDLKEWIIANMTVDMGSDDDMEWKDIFVIAVWLIWKFRNEYIHSNINTSLRIKEMKIKNLAREIRDARRRIENNQHEESLTVSWQPTQKD